MQTQIGKWGNSLAVRIPKTFAQDLGLKDGMDVDVSLRDGKLLYMVERRDIEQRSAEQIADLLTMAFDKYCVTAQTSTS